LIYQHLATEKNKFKHSGYSLIKPPGRLSTAEQNAFFLLQNALHAGGKNVKVQKQMFINGNQKSLKNKTK